MWATGGWSATIQGKDWGPNDVKGYWSVIREGDDWKIRMLTFNHNPSTACNAPRRRLRRPPLATNSILSAR